jgi:VRR-NUC domain.
MTEHQEQKALFRLFKLHERRYPELALAHAIPNGGHRHAAVAAKLKAEGVRAGVPDIFIPAPRGNSHGLYVELKTKGGRVSDAQRKMMAALAGQGYACLVCYGWEPAWEEIKAYLEIADVLVCDTALM